MRTISSRGTASMPNGYVSRRSSLRVNGSRRRSSSEAMSPGSTSASRSLIERDPLLDASDQRPQPFDLERAEPLRRQSLELGLEDHRSILTRRGGYFPIFPSEATRTREGRDV